MGFQKRQKSQVILIADHMQAQGQIKKTLKSKLKPNMNLTSKLKLTCKFRIYLYPKLKMLLDWKVRKLTWKKATKMTDFFFKLSIKQVDRV